MTTRQRLFRPRFSQAIIRSNAWLETKNRKINGRVDPTWFIACSTLVLTLAAFVYLDFYYGDFEIDYFRSYALEDAFKVLYEKGALFFIIPLAFVVAGIIMSIFPLLIKPNLHQEIGKNTIYVFSTIIIGVFMYLIFRALFDLPMWPAMVIGLLAAINVIAVSYFDLRTVYAFPFILGFALVVCARVDVNKRLRQKIRFNMTTADGRSASLMDLNGKTIWVGTTAKNVYLYNDSTREITEIPVGEVKISTYKRSAKMGHL